MIFVKGIQSIPLWHAGDLALLVASSHLSQELKVWVAGLAQILELSTEYKDTSQ
jgi:hypothetical protein